MRRSEYQLTCLLICVLLIAVVGPAGAAPVSLRQPDDADLDAGLYDAYFDDAVFVGDSIFQQLGRYVQRQRQAGHSLLGEARFLVAASYTIYQASLKTPRSEVQLRYRGRSVSVHEGLRVMEAGKAFVLLGLNDEAGSQLKKDVDRYSKIIDRAIEASPDLQFIAQSMTPIVERAQEKRLNQKNINAFNAELRALCAQRDIAYLDLATPLMDANGYLNPDFSTDKRVHLNEAGFEVMIDVLRRFARNQYEQGLWSPLDGRVQK